MNVKNLKIEGGDPNNCVAVFNGVAFMNAGGSIKNVTLNNIGQTTGCQSGRAIVVWNTDARRRQSVAIEGNTVSSLQQERDRRARQRQRDDPREHRHGQRAESTTSPRTASSSTGPIRSRRSGATRSAGTTTRPADTEATGILVIDAKVSIDRKNTLSGNEVDILNELAPSAARSSAPNNKGRRGRNTNP